MAAATAAALVPLLRRLRLLESAQLAEVEQKLTKEFGQAKELLAELVRRGWVTAFQADELRGGRGDGLLMGSYVLLTPVGAGGMGQVFKARQWKLDRLVAIKVIQKDRLNSPDAVRRFQREIRAAGQLDHPNIVRALDADELNGKHIFVMEYVEGVDLSTIVKENGPLPIGAACECVRQAALGLQRAHEQGMVHRDIKPGNLLLTTKAAGGAQVVKLLDMGLVRMDAVGEQSMSGSLTSEGSVMGTPDYIAPEQAIEAHGVDIRADLYSLGCTFYYLLSGRVPFPGGTLMQKLMKHRLEEPTPVEVLRSDVPPGVANIVRRLMAKAPEHRFQTPKQLAEALADPSRAAMPAVVALAQQHAATIEANPFADLDAGDTAHPTPTPRSRSSVHAQPKSKTLLAAGIGGGALLLVVVLGLVARSAFSSKPPVSTSTAEPAPAVVVKPTPRGMKDDAAEKERKLRAEAEEKRRNEAETQLALLAPAVHAVKPPDLPAVEKRVREFLVKYSGTPQAVGACELMRSVLAKRSSPLDELDAANLPEELAATWRAAGKALPSELVAVIGDLQQAPTKRPGPAAGVAFSPDGKRLIVGGDGEARVWEVPTLHNVATLAGFNESVHFAALLPNGNQALTGGDKLRLWDIAQQKVIATESDHVHIGGLSPDGTRVAGNEGNTISVWDVLADGFRRAVSLAGHKNNVHSANFSPDGSRLVSSGNDHHTRLWDLAANREAGLLGEGIAGGGPNHGASAFAPHGQHVAVGVVGGKIRVFDVAAPTPIEERPYEGITGYIQALAFSPDARWLVGTTNESRVILFEVAARRKHAEWVLLGPAGGVAFAPDARHFAVTNPDGTAYIFRVPGTTRPVTVAEEKKRKDESAKRNADADQTFPALARRADGAKANELPKLRDDLHEFMVKHSGTHAATKAGTFLDTVLARLPSPLDALDAAKVSEESRATWKIAGFDGRDVVAVVGNDRGTPARSVAFTPDGRLVTAGEDSIVRMWDVVGAKEVWSRPDLFFRLNHRYPALSANGERLLIIRNTAQVILAELTTGKDALALPSHTDVVMAAAFSPGGEWLLTAGFPRELRVWDVAANREVRRIDVGGGGIRLVALRPDGRLAASEGGPDESVQLWDVATGHELGRLVERGTVALTFGPDGRHLATCTFEGTRVRDAFDLTAPPATLATGRAVWLAYSPGGSMIAVVSADGRLSLWSSTGRLLREWRIPMPASHVAFAPDGRHLATANSNGSIYILRLPVDLGQPGKRP